MNYNDFIKAVDEKLTTMSDNEKDKWIHNLARTIQENERAKFLNSLNGTNNCDDIIYDIKEIQDWSQKIQNGDIYFECSYCEVYGENYWRDYSYEYYDTYEIGKKLTFAFQVAESVLYQKRYKEAVDLYNLLINMRFKAYYSDAEETIELEFQELVDERLVSLNIKLIVLNLIYAKYQTSEGKERASALFTYLKLNISNNIRLEEFFSVGPEELVGIDVFLDDLIKCLKSKNGDFAANLLYEACILLGGVEKLCNIAREMVQKHPILYLKSCEHLINERRLDECEKLGLKAMDLLDKDLIIRGKVADLTAKTAKELGHKEIVLECYKIAFQSESTLNHFLRLYEIENGKGILDIELIKVKTLPEKSFLGFGSINNEMAINIISKEHKKILQFFNGEFDYIYEKCNKKDKNYLGWSSNIKGVIVPLFILYLDQNKRFSNVGLRLIEGIKHRLNYSDEDEQSFIDRFLRWKSKIEITSEQHEKYITWLQAEVDKRTEAVVGGGFRKSYYKAAELISALGETMESYGNIGAKKIIIEHYKKVHSTKRAFKAEFEVLK